MLELLALPVTWLVFLLAGLLPRNRTIVFRRFLLAGLSLVLLLLAVGWQTAAFYAGIGLVNVTLGLGLVHGGATGRRRMLFAAGVAANAAMILCFLKWGVYFRKYMLFLPSLSYLGFRAIAYLTSCYRKPNCDLSSGLMQMWFFPMLFTGPISRVEDFAEERQDYVEALRRLALGLAMLIAARLAGAYVLTDVARIEGLAAWHYWVGIVANAFEFYWSFAGYTSLVVGLGLMVGFKLPENFNRPYSATSISDFWRRWHMSLSYWVRDYLYIPLGGNRKGLVRKCLNLMVAMIVMGLWHGLSANYLLWGLAHGTLLAGESVMAHLQVRPVRSLVGARLYVPAKVALTFVTVSLLWLVFRYPLPDLKAYVGGLVP